MVAIGRGKTDVRPGNGKHDPLPLPGKHHRVALANQRIRKQYPNGTCGEPVAGPTITPHGLHLIDYLLDEPEASLWCTAASQCWNASQGSPLLQRSSSSRPTHRSCSLSPKR